MAEKAKDAVVLRVEVPERFRTRLKTQAVRTGVTMGELIERLIDEPLRKIELEAMKGVADDADEPKAIPKGEGQRGKNVSQ